mgnify:CR=1 FL=1
MNIRKFQVQRVVKVFKVAKDASTIVVATRAVVVLIVGFFNSN